ncbi:MAG TPA: M14 metallopeptidase family protein [Longimicrobiales bacterium]|nr:M14 metallopeptidase family protein [Longimicrobiales bacterium]
MTRGLAAAALLCIVVAVAPATAQQVPTPASHFGFEPGTDRRLADWDQLLAYYEKLALSSPRVTLDTLGTTTMGRPFVMLTVTSPENHARLGELLAMQQKLADPRTIADDAELQRLLAGARTIALITHAIHSTEVGSAQTAARLLHRLASSNDAEILEILDNVILLDIPSLNPDGTDWVSEFYMQNVGTQFEGRAPPWLYQFYVGHDNNRDWYAFTQKETQLTIEHAHNVWRPHIVHDIHQMGGNGARIFFPPYIDPVERNVDPAIISGLNQLGSFMAARLTAEGKPGAVINAIYDAFTPARAYQHYHGGVRILSETASAEIATPVTIPAERVRGGRAYDAATASWNYPLPWRGGAWGLGDIVDYMESGALALLVNAARNRPFWVENFYHINRRAVEGWESWPDAWVIPADQANAVGLSHVLRILTMADVEVHRATAPFAAAGQQFAAGAYVIPMRQPYASFAQTMLEVQEYPDLREYPGGPPRRPYDVTAHTLPLLMDVEAHAVEQWSAAAPPLSTPIAQVEWQFRLPPALAGGNAPRIALYKSAQESMEAGWTRWVFDMHGLRYDTLKDARARQGDLRRDYDVIVLQSQDAESIREGHEPGSLPEQYTGGLGEAGVAALREFVRAGGRLVAIEEATEFAAELFDLPVTSSVADLEPQDFYVPGSILRLDVASDDPLAGGVGNEVHAWYWGDSRAFDVAGSGVSIVARYAAEDPKVSGWILGPEHIAGKPALVSAPVGEGSVVLFGFQPNYRGQTIATWPLLWAALTP